MYNIHLGPEHLNMWRAYQISVYRARQKETHREAGDAHDAVMLTFAFLQRTIAVVHFHMIEFG